MTTALRAYVCTSRTSSFTKGPYRVGNTVRASAGVLVARELDPALFEHGCWPIALHEVEVAPDQVLQAKEFYLQVRSFRVLRDVPLAEALGPRAEDVAALFGQLRRFPWLAPRTAPDAARVADLVRSHYAALAPYAPVEALPCRIVTTWADAMSADNDVLGRAQEPSPFAAAQRAAVNAAEASPAAEARGHAVRKAQIAPNQIAYPTIWEAAWGVASAALLTSAAKTGTTDVRTRVKTVERIRAKLVASRDRCRRSAWETYQALRANEDTPEPAPDLPSLESLAARSDQELMPAWLPAWNFADAATGSVSRAAAHLVALPDEPNPWLPLVELLRMGAWPIDEVDGGFVVYFPAVMN